MATALARPGLVDPERRRRVMVSSRGAGNLNALRLRSLNRRLSARQSFLRETSGLESITANCESRFEICTTFTIRIVL